MIEARSQRPSPSLSITAQTPAKAKSLCRVAISSKPHPATFGQGGNRISLKRDGDGGKFGGRVGVGDAAANSASVPDLDVACVRNRRSEHRGGVLENGEALAELAERLAS